ncbi:MAG: hypothetical protein JNJ60_03390 [Rhodocyclaceae bacterium]|nr:hypothetical protein [Rhodocyclaceae bacterium]
MEAHALYALNFYREAMARGGLRQIWWITPAVADRFSQCLPDLDSCFMVKLDLTETAPAVPEGDAKP